MSSTSQAPTGGLVARVWAEVQEDELTDRAASLTYYAVLSLFPMLLVLVSLVGLLGTGTTDTLLRNVTDLAPGPSREILTTSIERLREGTGTAGLVAIAGVAGALWSASGYVAAFMRASNAIYEMGEGRPIWKTAPVRLGVTLALVVLVVLSATMVVVTGSVARFVGDLVGVGDTAVLVWDIAKWPVLVLLVSGMFSLLYWAAPNVRQPGLRFVSPGGLLAVVVWLAASAGFALYAANFSSYDATYGALAGVVIFLVWLWLTNLALLLGAELNAELQRGRQIVKGMDPEREPFLPPRDTRKLDDPPDVDGLPPLDPDEDPPHAPDAGEEASVPAAARADAPAEDDADPGRGGATDVGAGPARPAGTSASASVAGPPRPVGRRRGGLVGAMRSRLGR